MPSLSRRDTLKILATASAAAALGVSEDQLLQAGELAREAKDAETQGGAQYAPKFFTPHEWATLRELVDYIIPRDERSGSATDAGVPEYIDFLLADQTPAPRAMAPTAGQLLVRGGLAWLDRESHRRFGKTFVTCTGGEVKQVLDDIAWPAKARPEMSQGVAFFTRIRDLTAGGFWSSRMGVRDIQYMGNIFVAEWKGCPDEVVQRLGVD